NAAFVSIMQDDDKADILLPPLILAVQNNNLQSSFNQALAFQLSDDKNIFLDDISQINLQLIKDYAKTQSPVNHQDWQVMMTRLE
ncbi:MAG: hypothetical protein Q4G13_05965, partial [Moraxella sp.]|nr:hypothetical protein [Moraxella sp.]